MRGDAVGDNCRREFKGLHGEKERNLHILLALEPVQGSSTKRNEGQGEGFGAFQMLHSRNGNWIDGKSLGPIRGFLSHIIRRHSSERVLNWVGVTVGRKAVRSSLERILENKRRSSLAEIFNFKYATDAMHPCEHRQSWLLNALRTTNRRKYVSRNA